MQAFSKDVEHIANSSGSIAGNFWQTWVGSPHIFMATTIFLNKKKESERYKETYTKLRDLLNAAKVTSSAFQKSFLSLFSRGIEPLESEEFKITWDGHDGQPIFTNLKNLARKELRETQVEDLIIELFSDRSYRLHSVLEDIIGSTAETDKLCEKIVEEFRTVTRKKENPNLEQIKGLTNLNRYVKEKKPVIIGADNAVNQIQLGLSGKSISNVMLVGEAGTGKTASVYEFVNRINNRNVIKSLRNKIVYQLDPGALVAGTRYRGKRNCHLQ